MQALLLTLGLHALILGALAYAWPGERRRRLPWVAAAALALVFNGLLLGLPLSVPALDVLGGAWNWTGKVAALLATIVSLVMLRQRLGPAFPGRPLPLPGTGRSAATLTAVLVVLACGVAFALYPAQSFKSETLAFQLTMPALEEELFWRGLLLALLVRAFDDVARGPWRHPALWLTALMFGATHGLRFGDDGLSFNALYLLQTMLFGLAWAWMALRTRSLLWPIVCHAAVNALGYLATSLLR